MNLHQTQLDRFAMSQSTFTRAKDNISDLRRAFIEMAKGINPTHFLTFNFYNYYSMEQAQKRMDEWNRQVHRRLFKTHPSVTPDEKALVMVGYPEYTKRDHLHYHCVARVNPSREDWFLRIAPERWNKIVRTGDLHIEPIRNTEVDLEAATVYMTKSSSFTEWYISSDYRGTAFAAGEHAGNTRH
ncbi:hypothetical protein EJP67_28455 [Variovorax guangxiensis]|uniref:Inovirus Gp2 family protein n=1 Tax=Variovorax guangxiensis TaxID=1775474 RepID=A0A3S1F5E8_9BURK|nr:hypothetical protein [Variovorax guangxiensis]RUR70992.1 hypothetical protein EJP67_28455 [Variovorax guangxiensis]